MNRILWLFNYPEFLGRRKIVPCLIGPQSRLWFRTEKIFDNFPTYVFLRILFCSLLSKNDSDGKYQNGTVVSSSFLHFNFQDRPTIAFDLCLLLPVSYGRGWHRWPMGNAGKYYRTLISQKRLCPVFHTFYALLQRSNFMQHHRRAYFMCSIFVTTRVNK